jgi:hypothetical protein
MFSKLENYLAFYLDITLDEARKAKIHFMEIIPFREMQLIFVEEALSVNYFAYASMSFFSNSEDSLQLVRSLLAIFNDLSMTPREFLCRSLAFILVQLLIKDEEIKQASLERDNLRITGNDDLKHQPKKKSRRKRTWKKKVNKQQRRNRQRKQYNFKRRPLVLGDFIVRK